MACPYCQGDATQELERTTAMGYRMYRCRPCRRTFNERTGTAFNHLQAPTDIALLVVLWRLRYKLSLRDLTEMFLTRGFTFTHETVREWEARFAPLLTERLRAKRRNKAGLKWHCDETYVKVNGRWCYLYRAIDADGNLVDSMLSETRDMEAAKRFFAEARTVVGHAPEKVTTDGHDAYPRAIRETLGPEVQHRTNRYMNNRLRHEVALLAVGTLQRGLNPVCCHRSPTATCDGSNPLVGRSRDNVALARKGQDDAARQNRDY